MGNNVKLAEREADHSPQSGTEVKNMWRYTSTPLTCLHGFARDNVTFITKAAGRGSPPQKRKGGQANKKLYTKSESLTVSCRAIWA
jgi:hypothetical protein